MGVTFICTYTFWKKNKKKKKTTKNNTLNVIIPWKENINYLW